MVLKIIVIAIFMLITSAGVSYGQQVNVAEDWQKIKLSFGSFLAPPGLKEVPFRGIDSQIWKFKKQDLILTIDLGLYSGKPNVNEDELNYKEKGVVKDGKQATIVSFKYREPRSEGFDYVSAIYFPELGDKYTKLSFVVHSKTPEHLKIAEKIFLSISFN
jgi:hypothetical protein